MDNTVDIKLKKQLEQVEKDIQIEFIHGSILGQNSYFVTEQEVDIQRKEIMKPFRSKILNETF